MGVDQNELLRENKMAKKHQIKISNKSTRRKANRKWRRQFKVTLSENMRKNINSESKKVKKDHRHIPVYPSDIEPIYKSSRYKANQKLLRQYQGILLEEAVK